MKVASCFTFSAMQTFHFNTTPGVEEQSKLNIQAHSTVETQSVWD
jgi:hypothetical protein